MGPPYSAALSSAQHEQREKVNFLPLKSTTTTISMNYFNYLELMLLLKYSQTEANAIVFAWA